MLRWHHPEKRRYYKAFLQYDLFGELCLVREWGSMDTGRGNFDQLPCPDIEAARQALRALRRRRKQRGYITDKRMQGRAVMPGALAAKTAAPRHRPSSQPQLELFS